MKLTLLTALLLTPLAAMQAADAPRPSPVSLVMLSGPWLPENPHQLDFASLPKVPSEHAVVSDVRDLRSTETVARPNTLPPLLKYGGCNNHSYRAISTDDGRTWSQPVKTNFPDATSTEDEPNE
jgi:hypothetical protein